MGQFEDAEAALDALIADAGERGDANEASTRMHLIDRLLFDCLGWERSDCEPEEQFGGTYSDYVLRAHARLAIWEAKREGIYFDLPVEAQRRLVRPIRYFQRNHPDVYAAIEQCLGYCQQRGTPVGVVCNGRQLVAFIASRDDGVAPADGSCLVVDSLAGMKAEFITVWNALSKEGVRRGQLALQLRGDHSPPPPKLSTQIPGYPRYKRRNQLQTELQILGDILIEDVQRASDSEEEFIRQCYAKGGALSQHSLVTRAIQSARYSSLLEVVAEGPSLLPAVEKRGPNPQLFEFGASRRPILLIGDIGVGKTLFIRNVMTVERQDVLGDAYAVYIDLGSAIQPVGQLGRFVASTVQKELLRVHGVDIEERSFVRGVYASDIQRFERGIYGELKESDPARYQAKLLELLEQRLASPEDHLGAALQHLVRDRNRPVVIFLDNVDQRTYIFQQESFLVANAMAERWPVAVVLTLRPESYYRSKQAGALGAYHPKAFTVSPPRLDVVIERRLRYAEALIAKGTLPSLNGIRVDSDSLKQYLGVLVGSFANRRRDLVEFCDNMCGGNVRLALEFVRLFIGSGHVNTQKILNEVGRQGRYLVPLHEFVRAVIYGDYEDYDPSRSEIVNVFDIGRADRREHFIVLILLSLALRASDTSAEGYVKVSWLLTAVQDCGYLPDQIEDALQRCLDKRLLERPARSTDPGSAEGVADTEVDNVRATSIGAYYLQRLVADFNYLDAIVTDTPIIDSVVRGQMRMEATLEGRLDRAELLRGYLDACWSAVDACAALDWPGISQAMADGMRQVRQRAAAAAQRANSGA